MKKLLNEVKFDDRGLVPAVTQDFETGEVLMVAYMNRESLQLTITERKAWYYSRSRQELWLKGKTSGNIQEVKEIRIDCDTDTILLKVKQIGDAACHTGFRSCFYRIIQNDGSLKEEGKKVFNPEEVYKTSK